MALQLDKTGIVTGQDILAKHVTQSVDAFTGEVEYDITISGSLSLIGTTTTAQPNVLTLNTSSGKVHVSPASTVAAAGSINNLQAVTDAGNVTTNPITASSVRVNYGGNFPEADLIKSIPGSPIDIRGSGYTGFVATGDSYMYIGNNSSGRPVAITTKNSSGNPERHLTISNTETSASGYIHFKADATTDSSYKVLVQDTTTGKVHTTGSYSTGGSTPGDTYELKAEAKSGTSVPLKLDAATGTDSTVNLTEGANITLTRTSATNISIAVSGISGGGSGAYQPFSLASINASIQNSTVQLSGNGQPTFASFLPTQDMTFTKIRIFTKGYVGNHLNFSCGIYTGSMQAVDSSTRYPLGNRIAYNRTPNVINSNFPDPINGSQVGWYEFNLLNNDDSTPSVANGFPTLSVGNSYFLWLGMGDNSDFTRLYGMQSPFPGSETFKWLAIDHGYFGSQESSKIEAPESFSFLDDGSVDLTPSTVNGTDSLIYPYFQLL
tara:strand:- start:3020 stop:4498 length:1479 start_codon:yes stop_codon:yes gene_type:complete